MGYYYSGTMTWKTPHCALNLAPPNRGGLNSTHIHGTSVPVEEPSTASRADIPTLIARTI